MRVIDIDICGQICPSCLLLTLRELNQNAAEIRAGDIEIVVVTDDRQATTTIPVAADRMGFRSEIAPIGERYRIRIFAGA